MSRSREYGNIIEFSSVNDIRGRVTFFEAEREVPFPIRRVYYIHNVPTGASRGFHAHKELERVIVVMTGAVRVVLDDSEHRTEYALNSPLVGLHVRPGLWIELDDFEPGTVCAVFASEYYNESDYIREYDDFVQWARRRFD